MDIPPTPFLSIGAVKKSCSLDTVVNLKRFGHYTMTPKILFVLLFGATLAYTREADLPLRISFNGKLDRDWFLKSTLKNERVTATSDDEAPKGFNKWFVKPGVATRDHQSYGPIILNIFILPKDFRYEFDILHKLSLSTA